MWPPIDNVGKPNEVKQSDSGNTKSVSDKVQRLREQIANGTYRINTQKIAERIVQSGVLDE